MQAEDALEHIHMDRIVGSKVNGGRRDKLMIHDDRREQSCAPHAAILNKRQQMIRPSPSYQATMTLASMLACRAEQKTAGKVLNNYSSLMRMLRSSADMKSVASFRFAMLEVSTFLALTFSRNLYSSMR